MKRATIVPVVAAFIIYVLSWLVPVVDGGTTLWEGGLPGWEVFRLALSPIWSYGGLTGDGWFSDLMSVLSALTNIGFLASVTVLAFLRQRFARGIFWGLVLASAINALWFVLSDERGDLRIGYFLWLSSFIVLTVAARSIRRASDVVSC